MRFFDAKMASKKIFVVMAYQLHSNSFRYKRYALMVKSLIDFFIAIGFLMPQFLSFAMIKHRFHKLGSGAKAKSLKSWRSDLKLKHLSMKTVNNKRFEYFQLKNWFFLHHLAEENKIEHW